MNIEFVDIFGDKTASLRNKPGGGNANPGGGKQTGPDGKKAPRCDVKAKSSNTKPRSGTRDSLPSRRQRKGNNISTIIDFSFSYFMH